MLIKLFCPCRRKPHIAEDVSDRELFDRLPLNDTWCDAKLFEVFNYLWQSKSTCIPESWFCTMYEFHEEFRGAVVGDPDLVAEYLGDGLIAKKVAKGHLAFWPWKNHLAVENPNGRENEIGCENAGHYAANVTWKTTRVPVVWTALRKLKYAYIILQHGEQKLVYRKFSC